MIGLIPGEEPRAICYLREDGNRAYMLELTNFRLLVTIKNRQSVIYLDVIEELGFNHRKQILLLIYGGIAAPLGMVALFGNLLNPFIMLLLIFSGFFAFYTGWTGNLVLTVNLVGGHQDFPIKFQSANLMEFVDFTNRFIRPYSERSHIYYYLVPSGINMPEAKEVLFRGGNFKLYSPEIIKKKASADEIKKDRRLIGIDPFKSGSEIKYEREGADPVIWPFLKGKIRAESIAFTGTVEELTVEME